VNWSFGGLKRLRVVERYASVRPRPPEPRYPMRSATLFSIGLWLFTVAATTTGEDTPPRAAPVAVPTAWGKPVDGLQAGIRIRPSDRGPDAARELAIVVRNVGRKESVLYQSLGLYFWGESDDGVVAARPASAYGGYAQPGGYLVGPLAPGKECTLIGGLSIGRPSAGRELVRRTRLDPGTYRVGIDRFELRVGERKTIELGTGYLDVVVPPEKK
jgi:hypothetical protein